MRAPRPWSRMSASGTSRPLRDNVQTDLYGGELDPSAVTSLEELVELLRRLHIRAGEPSRRALQKWARDQQQAGRPNIQLTRTTISEILSGKRVPSPGFLAAFLESCGIVGDKAQRPWLAARARIVEQRLGLNRSPSEPARQEQSEKQPENDSQSHEAEPDQRTADPRSAAREPGTLIRASSPIGKRWLIVAPTATLAILLAFVAVNQGNPPRTTMACLSESCAAAADKLTVNGSLSGDLAPGQEALILIRVESTKRWYIGPTLVPDSDGNWSHRISIGNPVPQLKDRHFTLCTYILPSSSIDELSRRLESYRGEGLPIGELPQDRTELACITAVRLANS